jgi:rhodanese-related sulfurtransferase
MPWSPTARKKRRFKDAAYEALATVPGALANKSRLELLELVAQRPRPVGELAAEAALTVANASQHLQVLARSRLVSVKRRGRYAYYEADEAVYGLLKAVHDIAGRAVDLDAIRLRHLGTAASGVADLDVARVLLSDPRSVLLDVRPREEYESGHLRSAVSLPLDALRRGEVPIDASRRYVVYCRGPFCVFADEAVALLEERGLEATRLALGPIEWVAAGEGLERAG